MLELDDAVRLAHIFGEKSARHQDSFVNSLGYYLLTGRGGAKIYSENGSYVVACEHPHLPDTTLIFPEIVGDGSLSARLLMYFKNEKGNFQLARYMKKDLDKLLGALCLHANRKIAELVPLPEEHMDWAFPVHILGTKITSEMKGKPFENVRNKFNKVSERLEVKSIKTEGALPSIKASLYFWVGGLIASGNVNAQNQMAFYESLIGNLSAYPDLYDGFVVYDKNEPVGFTVWDSSLDDTANSLASLSRRSIKGLSEFQIVTACKILNNQGIKFYNMGGSETKALDQHKRKFMPACSFEIYSYKVDFKGSGPTNMQVLDLV